MTTGTWDEDAAWEVVTRERARLADLLEGLAPERWETVSLAAPWTVREVAAHLCIVANPPSAGWMLRRALEARGNPDRMNLLSGRVHGRRPREVIVADLREHAGSRKVPIVTNPANVLFDVLVHVQDIVRPLDISWPTPLEAAVAAADRVWAMGWPFHARRRFAGLRLVATDSGWVRGDGPEVRGPTEAHLLALTGRPAALRDLSGPGAPELATRLAACQPSPPTPPPSVR